MLKFCAPCVGRRRNLSGRSSGELCNTGSIGSAEAQKHQGGAALTPEGQPGAPDAVPSAQSSEPQQPALPEPLRPAPSESSAAPVARTPSTDANALQSKLKVPFSELTFHALIGKGSFKQVYRGKWNNTNVAIVAMRKGGLVTEARLMQQLGSHPNLCQFYRWSTDARGNEYIVCELVPFGSLDKVLAHFGPSLRNRSKLMMCEQICHAMCELASEGVLHRDLAARNILVQSMQPVHIKVSDFGLSRVGPAPSLEPSDSTVSEGASQRGGRSSSGQPEEASLVPVRWSAPEVLRSGGGWSEKSDVWAYGITCWEIFSNGAEPYPSRSDAEAAAAIVNGELLPRPKNCPQPVYSLMVNCWAADPRQRPSFRQIADVFRRWREATLAAKAASGAGGGSDTNSPGASGKLPVLSGLLPGMQPVEPPPNSPTVQQQLHVQLQKQLQKQLGIPRAGGPLAQVPEAPLSSHNTPQASSSGIAPPATAASAMGSGPAGAAAGEGGGGGGYVPITALWRPEAPLPAKALAPIQSGEVLRVIDSATPGSAAPTCSPMQDDSVDAGCAAIPASAAAHSRVGAAGCRACTACSAGGSCAEHVQAQYGALRHGQPNEAGFAAAATVDTEKPPGLGSTRLQVASTTAPAAPVDDPARGAVPAGVQLSAEAPSLHHALAAAGGLVAVDARKQQRGPGPASGPTAGQSMVCSADVWLETAMVNEPSLSQDVSPRQVPGVQTPPQHQQSQPLLPQQHPTALSSGSGGVNLQPRNNLSDPHYGAHGNATPWSTAAVLPSAGGASAAVAVAANTSTDSHARGVQNTLVTTEGTRLLTGKSPAGLAPGDASASSAHSPPTAAHAGAGILGGGGLVGAAPALMAEPPPRYSGSGIPGPAGGGPLLPRLSRRGGGGAGGPGGFAAVPNFSSMSSGLAEDGRRSSRSALRWTGGASGAGPDGSSIGPTANNAGGSTAGLFYETCVLSMEVETAIDPMISMSTAASNPLNIFRGHPGAGGGHAAGAGMSSGGVAAGAGAVGAAHRLSAAARHMTLGLGDASRQGTGGMDSGERALRSLQGIMFMRQGTTGALSSTEVAPDEAGEGGASESAPTDEQDLPPALPPGGVRGGPGGAGGDRSGADYLGMEVPLDSPTSVCKNGSGERVQALPLAASAVYPPVPLGVYGGLSATSNAAVAAAAGGGTGMAMASAVGVPVTPAAAAPGGSSNPYMTIRELHQGNPY
ncbi:hypothetical protein HYH02_007865 [Chlamydomonas schloesseri]|uniref:Protein kinase domain-containing protein n=1 Tax=Chlamydomonas schloesseri TaxID=2026947 RepID=A0A835WGE3_9CHLO|nr:hypothetical protein HYH02_007865 [Chlamydomonas schloesseri]|eukprot:KAG2447119.1 hypothetical protein HYH02_007865 [Chlamydomonas schloesseri]